MIKTVCAENGQLNQMLMLPVMDTLDCMHDQKIVLIRNDKKEEHQPFVVNSSGDGIAATLDANYWKGTGARNGKEREYLLIIR